MVNDDWFTTDHRYGVVTRREDLRYPGQAIAWSIERYIVVIKYTKL